MYYISLLADQCSYHFPAVVPVEMQPEKFPFLVRSVCMFFVTVDHSQLLFNDPSGAKEYFTKSLELDPSNRKARFELSLLK